MIFQNSFQVQASLAQVADFHSLSANMAAITPPPVIVRTHEAPQRLQEGDQMSFTLWIGPLPIYWRALISDVSEKGFIDHQIIGPFEKWEHHHNFTAINEHITLIQDEVHIELAGQPLRFMIGLGMASSLPFLLAYRGWKTRRIMSKSSHS